MSKITLRPLPKQHLAYEKLFDKVTKYLLFGGGAGGGKSWLGCEWLIINCYQYPGTKWFIGRKELKRLMQSSYVTFQKVCKHHEIPEQDWKLNGQYNYIEFKNGSKIDLLDLSYQPGDPLYERFGSTEYTGGWIEEAGEVIFKAFDVLKTRIGRHLNKELSIKGKLLLTANPKKNWLKRIIWNPWKNNELDDKYAYVQSLYKDNVYTADEYGETLSEISDTATRQRLKDGNWEYDETDGSLVTSANINDLFTNTIDDSDEKYATLDVARFGRDKSVLKLWRGLKVYQIITWLKQGTDITAEKVKNILRDEKIPRSHLIIDEDGIGGGVLDQIDGAIGFIANSSPMERQGVKGVMMMRNGAMTMVTQKDNFGTLKDQCGFMLAEKINKHEMAIDCGDESLKEVIAEEIGELRQRNADGDGKKKLIPKEDIKENIGRSPDYLDNLIMRMKLELLKKKEVKQVIPYYTNQPKLNPAR